MSRRCLTDIHIFKVATASVNDYLFAPESLPSYVPLYVPQLPSLFLFYLLNFGTNITNCGLINASPSASQSVYASPLKERLQRHLTYNNKKEKKHRPVCDWNRDGNSFCIPPAWTKESVPTRVTLVRVDRSQFSIRGDQVPQDLDDINRLEPSTGLAANTIPYHVAIFHIQLPRIGDICDSAPSSLSDKSADQKSPASTKSLQIQPRVKRRAQFGSATTASS